MTVLCDVLVSDRRVIAYLSEDEQYAVMLRCNEFDIHRECLRPIVSVLGKSTEYTDDVKTEVLARLREVCINTDDLVVFAHDCQ